MNSQTVVDIGGRAIWVAMQVSAPVLLAASVTGLVVSILQAATQIQEQTLAFIPKVALMSAALIICGPWILSIMLDFTTQMLRSIPSITH